MRVHLASVAATLLATTSLALTIPASASTVDPVRPGTYVITNPKGQCLHTEGVFNAKVALGPCDTRWKVAPAPDGETIVIRHADTGNCLAVGLERIYPPRVATIPCEAGGAMHSWLVRKTEAERVTIASPRGGGYVTEAGAEQPLMVLPDDESGDRRLWTFTPA
ncbi:hypothetical protein ACLQ2R_08055 [Streptosporangium sp. DT93]|uniref:hypothetical protein n=1 Tax=Streptosporangium sp. DT93 TaxID=3393428 RepID=UPI003CEDDE09